MSLRKLVHHDEVILVYSQNVDVFTRLTTGPHMGGIDYLCRSYHIYCNMGYLYGSFSFNVYSWELGKYSNMKENERQLSF